MARFESFKISAHHAFMPRGRPRKTPKTPRHKINEWLAYKGMTAVELSDKLEVAQSTISRLLAGDSHYTQQSLEPIAEVLDVSVADLIGRDPTKPVYELYQVIDGLSADDQDRLAVIAKAFLRKSA